MCYSNHNEDIHTFGECLKCGSEILVEDLRF